MKQSLLARNLCTQLYLRSENDVFEVENSNLNKMIDGQDFQKIDQNWDHHVLSILEPFKWFQRVKRVA